MAWHERVASARGRRRKQPAGAGCIIGSGRRGGLEDGGGGFVCLRRAGQHRETATKDIMPATRGFKVREMNMERTKKLLIFINNRRRRIIVHCTNAPIST